MPTQSFDTRNYYIVIAINNQFKVHTPGFGLCKILMTNQHMGPFFECLAPCDQFSSLLLSSKPFVICLCCICAPLVYLCVDCIIHRDTASL